MIRIVEAKSIPLDAFNNLVPILEANPALASDEDHLDRIIAIALTSRALSRSLAKNPELISGVPVDASITLKLRAALISIAGDDMLGATDMATATLRWSDAMDEVVSEALSSARQAVANRHPLASRLPFTVIAMGKWGARELNYSSDVDLLFVHQAVDGEEEASRAAALALSGRLVSDLSAPTFDGPALEVDADLRPEGSMGPLSRSLESYSGYYNQWAEAWELQALLKARPSAGDADLGQQFMKLAAGVIWDDGLNVESLRSIRRIKEQTEANAKPRDIKRSRGGIRDIEFAVQILQLVHGRTDPEVRSTATLDALGSLAAHGYVEPGERDTLSESYIFLRNVEHRIQLWDLRQTHDLPSEEESLARIGRSLGYSDPAGEELVRRLSEVRARVRDLHEHIYFRPILDALVGSPSAQLGIDQATMRMNALGFTDTTATRQAIEDLTSGLSRRSRAMHQMLPLMLDWLSLSPDPDLGLAQLRILLAHSSDHSNLITVLQRSPLAGERLCLLLGTGRLLGDLIDRIPEFIPRLSDEAKLSEIRSYDDAHKRLFGLLESRPENEAKIGTIRRFSRRRKLRIAARDVLGETSVNETLKSLTDSADVSMSGAVEIATNGDPTGFAVVAMGKWGGRELSYGSDLDLMYVFANGSHQTRAMDIATQLSRVLSEPSRHGVGYELDASIRPEGKNGALVRSIDSYLTYYDRWGEPWELLALVKSRGVAGDLGLLSEFNERIGEILWQPEFPLSALRAIRSTKARVEGERIPPGEDPDFHLKLGPGGLSDVEFLVQQQQLIHGYNRPEVRLTGTLDALTALREVGVFSDTEHNTLRDSYLFCTRVRMRLHLQEGRAVDSLPTNPANLSRLAISLGIDRSSELREDYRRVTRRARTTFEDRFFE